MTHYVKDEQQEPEFLDRAEKLWLRIAIVVLLLFLAGVAAVTYYGFRALPTLMAKESSYKGEICTTPSQVLGSAAFSKPGPVPRPDGGVDVYVIGQMWQWNPGNITVLAGKPVRFFLTSADVIHGFRILDTPINVMVFPGMVASEEFAFPRPGTYQIACTEYCGLNHQNMISEIRVKVPQ